MATIKNAVKKTSDIVNASRATQISVGIIILALVGVGSYVGLSWRSGVQQQEAQRAFIDSFDSYKKAVQLSFDERAQAHSEELWDQVDQDFKAAGEQYGSSSLSPYYTMFRAQALVAQGNLKEGLSLMEQVITSISHEPQFSYLYKTTMALINLDTPDTSAQGLKQLEVLSKDSKNPIAGMAYYYLGEYYSSTGESEKAQQSWESASKLENKNPKSYELPSPWAGYSRMRLNQ